MKRHTAKQNPALGALEQIARWRLLDARVLARASERAASHKLGAIYLAGYAVECALKASLCRRLAYKELPKAWQVHDLERFMQVLRGRHGAGLPEEVNRRLVYINSHWAVDLRYSTVLTSLPNPREFIAVVEEMVEWLSRN